MLSWRTYLSSYNLLIDTGQLLLDSLAKVPSPSWLNLELSPQDKFSSPQPSWVPFVCWYLSDTEGPQTGPSNPVVSNECWIGGADHFSGCSTCASVPAVGPNCCLGHGGSCAAALCRFPQGCVCRTAPPFSHPQPVVLLGGDFIPSCWTCCMSLLNCMKFLSGHFSSLPRSFCMAAQTY